MSARLDAYQDYKNGMKPKAIADKYGVPLETVKSWIKRSKKSEAGAPAPSEGVHPPVKGVHPKSKKVPPLSEKMHPLEVPPKQGADHPKGGAPFGNQNAKGNAGGGAPPGNDNALKHGAFSKKYFSEFDPSDAAWVEAVPSNEEELLQFQLQDLLLKARYLERKIKETDAPGLGLAVDSLVREDGPHGKRSATTMRPLYERYLKLTAELDKTHGRITSITKALMQYREGRERLELERKRLALMEQKLLLEADQDGSSGPEMNLNIYLPDNGRDKDA